MINTLGLGDHPDYALSTKQLFLLLELKAQTSHVSAGILFYVVQTYWMSSIIIMFIILGDATAGGFQLILTCPAAIVQHSIAVS